MCVKKLSWAFYFSVNSCEFLLVIKQFHCCLFSSSIQKSHCCPPASGIWVEGQGSTLRLVGVGFLEHLPSTQSPGGQSLGGFLTQAMMMSRLPAHLLSCPQLHACLGTLGLRWGTAWKTNGTNHSTKLLGNPNFSMHGSQQGCWAGRKYSDTDLCSVLLPGVWLGEERDNKIPDLVSNDDRRQEKGEEKKHQWTKGADGGLRSGEFLSVMFYISPLRYTKNKTKKGTWR